MDLDERIEKAEAKWQQHYSSEEALPSNPWGFFSYRDAPGAIGGGVGAFVWFATRNEALDFIAEVLPFSPPGSSTADWDAVATDTRQIVDKMKAGTLDDSDGVAALNKSLRTFSQISFFGHEQSILIGDGKFPRSLRAQYLNERASDDAAKYDEDGETDVPAISSADQDDFQSWMGSYGF